MLERGFRAAALTGGFDAWAGAGRTLERVSGPAAS